jgi:hypothetical protein
MLSDPAAPLVSLGQLQLQIKVGVANNYDSQALGLVAVLVTVAAAIASVNNAIGTAWWVPLPTLGAAIVACVTELRMDGLDTGLPLGQAAVRYEGFTEEQINAASVLDMIGSLDKVDGLLRYKRLALSIAVVFIGITAVVSACVFPNV